jgi:dipeptidyl aminopeptidase/acylaminoacyl peptidase
VAPYGEWVSPISAALAGAGANSLACATCSSGLLFWVEGRPAEQGRSVVMMQTRDGAIVEVTPPQFNVRTLVHEYGGLPHAHVGNAIAFSNFDDQLLYLHDGETAPRALTLPGYRYADGHGTADGRLYCVREDHTGPGEAKNTIVAIDVTAAHPGAGQVLFDGADFVAYPRANADGRRLAFISWDHPNMPFDATRLHVGAIGRDGLRELRVVAGAGGRESVLEPQWDGDGSLYFLSDSSGFWNLFRFREGRIDAVTSFDADLGGPLWTLGASTYALTGDGRALARVCRKAIDELVLIDLESRRVTPLALPFASFGSIGVLDASTGYAIAASATALPALITIDLASGAHRVIRRAGTIDLADGYISRPEPIEFPTHPGREGSARTAHAFLFAPCNPHFRAPARDKPPLIVLLHGGPTSHSSPVFAISTQFWTTRGFAVASVNYGGSSGYGRAYRERLLGQWGVVDLQDAVAVVDFLVAGERVDARRIAVRGGSAGGFTVLCALAFSDRFNAGINYFGVADAEALAQETHKFESRYCDSLIAPLPQGRDLYLARSPIRHLDNFHTPLITFQGAEDCAVPPEQSRTIVAALRAKGVPVAYIEFPGEQHGFRDARNIARALEAELYFLGRVLGFTPAGDIAPVVIDNL